VSYLNNDKPGTATLTLTGSCNYTGTKSANFTVLDTNVKAIFDALGGKIGGKGVVTQDVNGVYGTLPTAVRYGFVSDGWFLGVTNGAPQAIAGGAVLAAGDHTLFARWSYDPAVTPDPDTIYRWEAIDANTARILGFKSASQKLTVMALPDRIGGRFVTEIGTSAFANSTCGATKLILPMFCTKIADKAFLNIPSIADITFADTRAWDDPAAAALLSIGRYAFSGAKGLTMLSLGDSVGSLGDYAFLNARKLSSITILGKPTAGTQVFRSSGMDAGGVTVHLDPALASDAAYMATLKADMYNVTVKTDAIVTGLATSMLGLNGTSVKLTLAVEKAADWGEVDTGSIRVKYRKSLSDSATVLTPSAAMRNADGSVTLEVVTPDGESGFFQAVIEK